jgi:hypothetical protein
MTATLLAVACVGIPGVRESELPGEYVESLPNGTIVLVLKEDHSFVETVEAPGLAPVTVVGKWTYNQNDAHITLDGAAMPANWLGDPQHRDYSKLEKGMLWGLGLEHTLTGGLRLMDSPDFDLAFTKKNK